MTEQNEVKRYYAGNMFFDSECIGTAEANGFAFDELTEISQEDFEAWFAPPDGKYGAWVDGKPVLLDIPEPDYQLIAERERDYLIGKANEATYTSMLKMQMGRTLSDVEKASVNDWLDYIDTLNALDMSIAPDIEWPEKPE